ncbi:MAG: hypothetical protein LBV08_05115 [Clostridiales bacterium]|jgi:hypothetical protein|nr:hypothetical protein [Clostridiales bacterium]
MKKKGASSVLVVFIMIIFVTIGAFVILSANVNLNFSKKVEAWNKDYYLLEEESERFIAAVDSMLLETENEAAASMGNTGALNFESIYVEILKKKLNMLKNIYPSIEANDDLELGITFNSKSNEKMLMGLKLKLLIPSFADGVFVKPQQGARYYIEQKKEWQEYSN